MHMCTWENMLFLWMCSCSLLFYMKWIFLLWIISKNLISINAIMQLIVLDKSLSMARTDFVDKYIPYFHLIVSWIANNNNFFAFRSFMWLLSCFSVLNICLFQFKENYKFHLDLEPFFISHPPLSLFRLSQLIGFCFS